MAREFAQNQTGEKGTDASKRHFGSALCLPNVPLTKQMCLYRQSEIKNKNGGSFL